MNDLQLRANTDRERRGESGRGEMRDQHIKGAMQGVGDARGCEQALRWSDGRTEKLTIYGRGTPGRRLGWGQLSLFKQGFLSSVASEWKRFVSQVPHNGCNGLPSIP